VWVHSFTGKITYFFINFAGVDAEAELSLQEMVISCLASLFGEGDGSFPLVFYLLVCAGGG
jgi:hypothetical protein